MVRNSQAEALRFAQNNTWLNELDGEFLTLKDSGFVSIKGKELAEDEPIKVKKWLGLFTQTVEPFSALRYFGEPYKVPFSDHVSISKPRDEQQVQYRQLVHFIRRVTDYRAPMQLVTPSPETKDEVAVDAAGHGWARAGREALGRSRVRL
jgi:hypothetical protein